MPKGRRAITEKQDIVVREEPDLNPQELWDFYAQNNCCETRYTFEQATSVIGKSDVVVTARDKGKFVGVTRAVTDGLDASIMELSVAPSHQGEKAAHGAPLVEDDAFGVGKRLADVLVEVLLARGVYFIQGYVYKTEVEFYRSAGFSVNTDHYPMYIDRRPSWDG